MLRQGIGRRTCESRQVSVETTTATSLHAYRIRDRTRRTTRLFVHAALFLATDGNDQMNSARVEANTSLSFGPGSQEGMCKRCWTCIQGYNLLYGLDLPDGPSSVDCRRSSLYAEPKMRLRYGPVCAAWHGAALRDGTRCCREIDFLKTLGDCC